ncbi:MAG: glycosyltransferase family 39 protein [Victivallales bacterium]|jgi:hypothetical protein|nr:glycosyltransferase family 39 protein [Victivallales bacterium]
MAGNKPIKNPASTLHPLRGFLPILGAIAVIALLLRLGVAYELGSANGGRNSVYAPSLLTDLATYMQLGRDVAAGKYSGVFYYQPFYYAVFLPVCNLLSGNSIDFVIFIQALLGAATCYLAGLSATHLAGKKAGYVAAVLVAISTPLLLYTPFHQNETLQAFNLTLLFYLTLRACERWGLGHWIIIGVIAGTAILSRGNAILFLPGIVFALIWSGKRRKVRSMQIASGVVLFLGFTFLMQLPFAVHNTRITGRLSGASTAADAVLALGNSPEAPAGGRNPGLPAGPMEYPEAYERMMKRVSENVSVPEQMFQWMCQQPGAFFELQFRKLLLFWDYREIPNNVSLYGDGQDSLILRYLSPGRSIVLLPLGLSGLLLILAQARRKREVRLFLLVYFVAAYWAGTALFYILSRFRAPILPMVAIAAGFFVAWVIRRWKLDPTRRKESLLYGGLTFVAMFYLVSSSYDFYRVNLEPYLMRIVRPDGTCVSYGGRAYQLDYGPMTFGGWETIEMKPHQRLSKQFPGFFAPGEVEWIILTENPGNISFRVSGKFVSRNADKAGFTRLRFEVSPQNEGFTIEIVRYTGKHLLLYDTQRDYSRSQLDGMPLKGEYLMRLYERN